MKKHIFKLLALGITAGLVFSFAACGNESTLEDPSTTGESTSEPETVVETVTDADGNIVLDENGEPVTEVMTVETVEVPVLDENGNQVLDENGKPVTKTEQQKKPYIPAAPSGNTGGQQSGSSSSGSGAGNNTPSGGSGNSGNSGNTGNSGNAGSSGGNTGGSGGNTGNAGSGNQEKPVAPTKDPDDYTDSEREYAVVLAKTYGIDKAVKETGIPADTINYWLNNRTWEYLPELSRQVFDAVNAYRVQHGVAALGYSQSEADRAKEWAEKDAINQTPAEHGFEQIGTGGTFYAFEGGATAQDFVNLWDSSPGHKANMLDTAFTQGGAAVYKDNHGIYYVVMSFYLDW